MKYLATLSAVAVFLASRGMASPTTETPPQNSFKEPSLIVSAEYPNKASCLTARSSGNGAPVTTEICDDAKDKWIFANGGLKLAATKDTNDVCLDVTDNCGENGTKLQVWKCNGGIQQQFAYDEAHQWFVWTSKDKKKYCVDLTKSVVTGRAQIWSCYGDNPNQKWIPRASTTTKGDPTPTDAPKSTTVSKTVAATDAPKETAAHDGHGAEGAKEGAKEDAKEGQAAQGESAGQSAEGNFFSSFKTAVDDLVKKYSTTTAK